MFKNSIHSNMKIFLLLINKSNIKFPSSLEKTRKYHPEKLNTDTSSAHLFSHIQNGVLKIWSRLEFTISSHWFLVSLPRVDSLKYMKMRMMHKKKSQRRNLSNDKRMPITTYCKAEILKSAWYWCKLDKMASETE